MILPTDIRDLSPIDSINLSDPGDVVQGKFRYQHAYGVILLVRMATGKSDYTAVWCEQQEDFLAESVDGVFDAYQIKTRKSELGEWQLNDDSFWKSIARFVNLDMRYPDKIRNFFFVSNTQFSNSSAKDREQFSPCKLLIGIKLAVQWEKLLGNAKKGFEWLKDKIEVEARYLFSVLQRLEIVLGPTERDYNDVLVQRLAALNECESMNVSSLSKVRETLISMVSKASSRVSDDPSRDWVGLTCKLGDNPFLHAKKITIEDIILEIRDVQKPMFRFLPSLASLQLGSTQGNLGTLKQKMYRGGLAGHYDTMRRRALSAEQKLLDLASRPNDGEEIVSQIENVVLAECDDAYLRVSQIEGFYGRTMLIDVQERLRRISEQEPMRVHRQSYDLLVGVAGILTSECKVWWSEIFEIEAEL